MLHKGFLGSTLHKKHSKGHDGGWAVSYADFLMVLLSFFIVFFSVDKNTSLHQIVMDLADQKAKGAVGPGNGTTALNGTAAGSSTGTGTGGSVATKNVLETIANEIMGAKVETSELPERILLDLPNDIYALGKYEAPKRELDQILKQLKRYEGKIAITVIGYSDANGFQKTQPIAKNNLTLSSVRAAYASIYIQSTLDDVPVWTQASTKGRRVTRSLTLIIENKKEDAP